MVDRDFRSLGFQSLTSSYLRSWLVIQNLYAVNDRIGADWRSGSQPLTAQPLPRAVFFVSGISTNVRLRLPRFPVPLLSSNVVPTAWLNLSMLIRRRCKTGA
jgi:hypothetical protein